MTRRLDTPMPVLRRLPRLVVAWCAVVVAGCAVTEPVAEPPAERKGRDWLAEIRSEARRLPSNVHVMPLEEPAVADLRARAEADAAARRFGAAADAWQRAIDLSPADPTLWQGLAEARIGEGRWAAAEEAARRALALGPGVGELCLRGWLTVHAARIEQRDAIGAAEVMHRVADCQAAPPPRY